MGHSGCRPAGSAVVGCSFVNRQGMENISPGMKVRLSNGSWLGANIIAQSRPYCSPEKEVFFLFLSNWLIESCDQAASRSVRLCGSFYAERLGESSPFDL